MDVVIVNNGSTDFVCQCRCCSVHIDSKDVSKSTVLRWMLQMVVLITTFPHLKKNKDLDGLKAFDYCCTTTCYVQLFSIQSQTD